MRETASPENAIFLHFVGDVMLARGVGEKISECGSQVILSHVEDTLKESDLLCGNLESPISKNSAKTGAFRARIESVGVIKDFNIVSLANNHIYDCGDEGIADTIDILSANKINYVGIGETQTRAHQPVILNVKGWNIGIFGCTTINLFGNFSKYKYHVPFIEDEQMLMNVKEIRNEIDFIVLLFHGGNEFIPYPPPSVRNGLRNLVLNGVDLVVGHHPHVLSGYEKVGENKLIWYSLGDFIFDSYLEDRRRSGILRIRVNRRCTYSFELLPTHVDDGLQVRRADDKLSQTILAEVEANSEKLQELNYEKKFPLLYVKKFIKFQIRRLYSIRKHEGFWPTIKFVVSRAKHIGYHISKFIKKTFI